MIKKEQERRSGAFRLETNPVHMLLLPCETISAKLAINDKLQGYSVATYLRCCGVVNNQIKKGLLLNVRVKKLKICEYLAKLPAKAWLSRALWTVTWSHSKIVTRTNSTRHGVTN